MTAPTVGFQPERLVQAREARGLTSVALSEIVGVSASAISHYERGEHAPKPEVAEQIAKRLNLPLAFFLRPASIKQGMLFWRSINSATKHSRTRATRKLEWLREAVSYFSEYLEFPPVQVPDLEPPADFREIEDSTIESFAAQVRSYWRLGRGPIADVVRSLEANGICVARDSMGTSKLDGLSMFAEDRPYVFLNSDKGSYFRSRFDAAHELGHMVLHRSISARALQQPGAHKILEDQAHLFAAAFLLPAKEFSDELYSVSIDSFRSMKSRWGASIACMIRRVNQMKLVNDGEAKRMWINLSRRGWRTAEPLDDLPAERPKMLSQAVQVLTENRIKTKEQILHELALSARDAEQLIGVDEGFFNDHQSDNVVRLRPASNVIPFSRKS